MKIDIIDISSYESLNNAKTEILQRIRELQYALAAVETISLGHHLRMGLITTEEMLNKTADISLRAVEFRLKPGDRDLITGLVVQTDEKLTQNLDNSFTAMPIAALKDRF